MNQNILMQPWQWCEAFLWRRRHYTKGMLPDYLILSKYGVNLIGKLPRQGLTVGSEFGGTYDNFYMAMWDSKGLMFK